MRSRFQKRTWAQSEPIKKFRARSPQIGPFCCAMVDARIRSKTLGWGGPKQPIRPNKLIASTGKFDLPLIAFIIGDFAKSNFGDFEFVAGFENFEGAGDIVRPEVMICVHRIH